MMPIEKPVEYMCVRLAGIFVCLLCLVDARVKRIHIFHKKLFRTQQTSSWSWFITELASNLVYTHRQGLGAVDFSADKFGDLFLMSRG